MTVIKAILDSSSHDFTRPSLQCDNALPRTEVPGSAMPLMDIKECGSGQVGGHRWIAYARLARFDAAREAALEVRGRNREVVPVAAGREIPVQHADVASRPTQRPRAVGAVRIGLDGYGADGATG